MTDHTDASSEAVPQADIEDRVEERRFVAEVSGAGAELTYKLADGRLVLIHTGVPDALGGEGLGGRLVRAAAEKATRENLVIVPQCDFARRWLTDHEDVAAGVSIDWEESGR